MQNKPVHLQNPTYELVRNHIPAHDEYIYVIVYAMAIFLSATPLCFGELYILQGSEVSMSNFVLLFDTWFLLHSLILLMFLCLLV